MELKTTRQVARLVKTTTIRLIADIGRFPQLKPALQLPGEGYLWNEAEVERLKAHRAARKPGRPKQKS